MDMADVPQHDIDDYYDAVVYAAPNMHRALGKLHEWMLNVMTEGDNDNAIPDCPCCYMKAAFHNSDPEYHFDGCPWPGVLQALGEVE